MATYRLCFATSPESAASLHEQITGEEDAGYLAGLAYKDTRLWSSNVPRQWLPTTSLQHSGIAIACVASISVVLQGRYWKDSRPRSLILYGIPFPALPQLLLYARGLVTLHLIIPHSGYFSPEAMVTGLSALPRLEHLDLEFLSSRSQPNRARRRPPLQTRIVLPALRKLNFKGVNEYLEDLVAQINAPLLRNVYITLFNQLAFDVSQFSQFIGRAENLNAFNQAEVVFYHLSLGIRLHPYKYRQRMTRLSSSESRAES